jgi:hypothetical protein
VITFALSGQRQLRELTEIADKLVKVQLERSKGVGAINSSAGTSGRSTSTSTPTAWPPIACRLPPYATRWRDKTPRCLAETSAA